MENTLSSPSNQLHKSPGVLRPLGIHRLVLVPAQNTASFVFMALQQMQPLKKETALKYKVHVATHIFFRRRGIYAQGASSATGEIKTMVWFIYPVCLQ